MAKRVTKFLLVKGKENELYITIKQNGLLDPMKITPTDTFRGKLIRLEDDVTVDLEKHLEVVNAENGKIKLVVSKEETNNLINERGPKEDHYYLRATYKLLLECNTVNNGYFTARINNIYVSN